MHVPAQVLVRVPMSVAALRQGRGSGRHGRCGHHLDVDDLVRDVPFREHLGRQDGLAGRLGGGGRRPGGRGGSAGRGGGQGAGRRHGHGRNDGGGRGNAGGRRGALLQETDSVLAVVVARRAGTASLTLRADVAGAAASFVGVVRRAGSVLGSPLDRVVARQLVHGHLVVADGAFLCAQLALRLLFLGDEFEDGTVLHVAYASGSAVWAALVVCALQDALFPCDEGIGMVPITCSNKSVRGLQRDDYQHTCRVAISQHEVSFTVLVIANGVIGLHHYLINDVIVTFRTVAPICACV